LELNGDLDAGERVRFAKRADGLELEVLLARGLGSCDHRILVDELLELCIPKIRLAALYDSS
jgi:hypothetical protein